MRFSTSDYPHAVASLRSLFGVEHAPEPAGVDPMGAPFFQMQLKDGTTGYFQRRTDDCMQVAVATLLQINPWFVPDSRLVERRVNGETVEYIGETTFDELQSWLAERDLTLKILPPEQCKGKWIGVTDAALGMFKSHCLIVRNGVVMFDPLSFLPQDKWSKTVRDIDYGIAIESIEDCNG